MKKIIILSLCLIVFGIALWAQEAPRPQPRAGFEGTQIIKDTEAIDIDVKAFMPESGIYKAKSETYSKSGKYRFLLNDQIIKDQSETILNKWLKESK